MDQIANSPGLQHITEDILLNLDFKNIKFCQSVNKTFGEILVNPIFWLKKFRLITKNPGLQSLQQINEDVFLDFDFEDLEFLKSINKTFEEILANPTFWLKKCIGGLENLSKLRLRVAAVVAQNANLEWSEEELAKQIQIKKDRSDVWSFVKRVVDGFIALPMPITTSQDQVMALVALAFIKM